MPGMNGDKFAAQLLAESIVTPVIIATNEDITPEFKSGIQRIASNVVDVFDKSRVASTPDFFNRIDA